MWKFGVYADRDSFFIGGDAGKWVGVHFDLPGWGDCAKFGAPYAVYVHWWPKKCLTVPLGWLFGEPDSPVSHGDWITAARTKKCCAVKSCTEEGDNIHFFLQTKTEVRGRNGSYSDLGSTMFMLCSRHRDMAEARKLRYELIEVLQ